MLFWRNSIQDVAISEAPAEVLRSQPDVCSAVAGDARPDAGGADFERKYVFAGGVGELLRSWLAATLRPDPVFPIGRIASLYYDTPDFRLYGEKRNSDFLKTKVRLRWYETDDDSETVPCFMEVKRKTGSQRGKVRTPLDVPKRMLDGDIFSNSQVLDFPRRADPSLHGVALLPLLVVQYDRERFIDPVSGCRVALDTRIRCLRVNPAVLPASTPVRLSLGVLETKGGLRHLPPTIEPLARHLRLEAFSKYATCCEYTAQPLAHRI